MKKFNATAVITLPSGCVRIDAAQLRTRAHNLTALEDGTHRIERPIQFKAGERFEWDGEAPKARAADFGEVGASGEVQTGEPAAEPSRTSEVPPSPRRKSSGRRLFA